MPGIDPRGRGGKEGGEERRRNKSEGKRGRKKWDCEAIN